MIEQGTEEVDFSIQEANPEQESQVILNFYLNSILSQWKDPIFREAEEDFFATNEDFKPEEFKNYKLWKTVISNSSNEEQIVGILAFKLLEPKEPGAGEIVAIAVDQTLRNKGIASKMMNNLIEKAKGQELNLSKLVVMTTPYLKAAQEMYKKFGFKLVSESQDYYLDTMSKKWVDEKPEIFGNEKIMTIKELRFELELK